MSVIDEYLASVPEPQKQELERVRRLAKQVAPETEETISYQIPALTYQGKPLIYFAAFKDHLSVFPTSKPLAELSHKLSGFKQAKGTLQFTVEKPIPDELVTELVKIRVKDIDNN